MQKIKGLLNSEKIGYIEIAFKVIYIIHLLASFNIFLLDRFVLNITLISVVLLGGFVVLCRLANINLYFKTPGIFMLIAFVISFLIPSFLIYRYDIFSSIKTVIWMVFQFGILFSFSTQKSEKMWRREFFAVSLAIVIFITLENIASIATLCFEYYEVYMIPSGKEFAAGIAPWGRLFGVHTDPNYSCVYSLTAILISLYLFLKHKHKGIRVLLCIEIFINFTFVVLSASRTGVVCALVGVGSFAAFNSFAHFGKKAIFKAAAVTLCALLAVTVLRVGITESYNGIVALNSQISGNEGTSVGRDDEEFNGDISNRRFDIWQSGAEIAGENIVFGIGFENVLGYANDKMPDTYIVNNDHSDFDAFHNTVVDILVSQGIVGIVIAIIFAVQYLIKLLKCYKKIEIEFKGEAALCLSICIMVLVSALFLSHIFYVNCPTTYIFWAYAGYLAYLFVTRVKTKEDGLSIE